MSDVTFTENELRALRAAIGYYESVLEDEPSGWRVQMQTLHRLENKLDRLIGQGIRAHRSSLLDG